MDRQILPPRSRQARHYRWPWALLGLVTGGLLVVGMIITASPASAHQPHLVNGDQTIIVNEPEISKAFYGQLAGQPAHYKFTAVKTFDLYVNILVPDIVGATADYAVTINRDNAEIGSLAPLIDKWTPFREPYGADDYFKGPEFRATGQAGQYDLVVSSPDNDGKYVLAVGETENFTFEEARQAVVKMPELKRYFGKSGWSAFESPLIYGPTIIIALVIGFMVWRLIKRRRKSGGELKSNGQANMTSSDSVRPPNDQPLP